MGDSSRRHTEQVCEHAKQDDKGKPKMMVEMRRAGEAREPSLETLPPGTQRARTTGERGCKYHASKRIDETRRRIESRQRKKRKKGEKGSAKVVVSDTLYTHGKKERSDLTHTHTRHYISTQLQARYRHCLGESEKREKRARERQENKRARHKRKGRDERERDKGDKKRERV